MHTRLRPTHVAPILLIGPRPWPGPGARWEGRRSAHCGAGTAAAAVCWRGVNLIHHHAISDRAHLRCVCMTRVAPALRSPLPIALHRKPSRASSPRAPHGAQPGLFPFLDLSPLLRPSSRSVRRIQRRTSPRGLHRSSESCSPSAVTFDLSAAHPPPPQGTYPSPSGGLSGLDVRDARTGAPRRAA